MLLPDRIVTITGPVSYKVHLDIDDRIVHKHQDQLRKGYLNDERNSEPQLPSTENFVFPSAIPSDTENTESNNFEQVSQSVRKSTRVRRAPDKLTL